MYISSNGRMYPVILIEITIPHDKIISSDCDHTAMVMRLTGDTTAKKPTTTTGNNATLFSYM